MEIMLCPYREAMTPPVVAVEPRELEVERESFRVSERDLRRRLCLGEEPSDETGGALEKGTEDGDDARTLPVEVDASERRFRSWRSAVKCSSTTPMIPRDLPQCRAS